MIKFNDEKRAVKQSDLFVFGLWVSSWARL